MKKVYVTLNIDEEVLLQESGQPSLEDAVSQELGWLRDSGMILDDFSFAPPALVKNELADEITVRASHLAGMLEAKGTISEMSWEDLQRAVHDIIFEYDANSAHFLKDPGSLVPPSADEIAERIFMERFPSGEERNSMIYLIEDTKDQGLWQAKIGTANDKRGALLTEEQGYPVMLYYARIDLNGSTSIERDHITTQAQLLQTLNWCGMCGYPVLRLWDFQLESSRSEAIQKIFDNASRRRSALCEQDMNDVFLPEDEMPTHTNVQAQQARKPGLESVILAAEEKTTKHGKQVDDKPLDIL